MSESDATRKDPFGLVVITGSETLNDEKIVSLYESGKFRIPTMIIYPEEMSAPQSLKDFSAKNNTLQIAYI